MVICYFRTAKRVDSRFVEIYSCDIRSNYSKPLPFVRRRSRFRASEQLCERIPRVSPLENVSSIVPPRLWPPPPQGVRMESWLKARLGWKREARVRNGGEECMPDSAPFFRTIDARQNFRAPFSIFPPPSLLLPFLATSGGGAARCAYVTPHLHNAAANCQCGRFENKICAAVPRRKGGALREAARGSWCAGHVVSKAPGVRFKELCRRINFPDFQPP